METTERNRRIMNNTLFLYFRMAFVLVISLYTSRVILNTLGVEDYGVYSVVGGFVSMFGFLNASISSCIQRFYNYEYGKTGENGFRRVFTMSCYIELILSFIILLLLEAVGLWYINHKLVVPENRIFAIHLLFQLSSFQMIVVMLQAPFSGAILAKEKMDFYAAVGIADVILKLLIVFLLPHLTYDKLVSFGVLMTLISVFDLILYSLYSLRNFKEMRFHKGWDSRLFKEMISFSGWNAFGAAAMVGRTQGLNLILNFFFGPVVNAARGVAVQVQGALMGFIGNISIAARPQIVESYAIGDLRRSKALMYSISKISFLFLFMMALPVSLNINYILHIWLGKAIPEHTAIFTVLILMSSMVDVLNTPVTMLVMATGDVKRYCLYTSLSGLLVLPMAYCFLLKGMPPSFVFVAGIIVSVLVQLISLLELSRITGVSLYDYFKSVVLPLLSVVIICTVLMKLLSMQLASGIYALIVTTICSMLLITIVAFSIVLSAEERRIVIAYAGKLCSKAK